MNAETALEWKRRAAGFRRRARHSPDPARTIRLARQCEQIAAECSRIPSTPPRNGVD